MKAELFVLLTILYIYKINLQIDWPGRSVYTYFLPMVNNVLHTSGSQPRRPVHHIIGTGRIQTYHTLFRSRPSLTGGGGNGPLGRPEFSRWAVSYSK